MGLAWKHWGSIRPRCAVLGAAGLMMSLLEDRAADSELTGKQEAKKVWERSEGGEPLRPTNDRTKCVADPSLSRPVALPKLALERGRNETACGRR
eukprot:scaffold21543_cov30-Tisochrysis_lutea.AAC.2